MTKPLTKVKTVYLFQKLWNGKYYYPGFCFECDNRERKYFSEKPMWFKRRNNKLVFPPETDDQDVTLEIWPVKSPYIYLEHVQDLYDHMRGRYHEWANAVKRPLEVFIGQHNKNERDPHPLLIRQAEAYHTDQLTQANCRNVKMQKKGYAILNRDWSQLQTKLATVSLNLIDVKEENRELRKRLASAKTVNT